MIVYFITSVCALCSIVTLVILKRFIKEQENKTDILINSMYTQLQIIKYLGNAESCVLWKIRQDIYNWQCQWCEREEFEAAQQANMMNDNIEQLINFYKDIDYNENNERANEPGV